jgi:hypothetical protein
MRFGAGIAAHFRERDPTFRAVLGPLLLVSVVLFIRSPYTNYIFDEQEALLANPYVNGHELAFGDVLSRDFWGLPPDRSIGSYRPLPNVLWRLLWKSHERLRHPWVHHVLNIIVHGVNAALFTSFSFRLTRSRVLAWLAGGTFVAAAVVTEAVAGVVGLADVLGGLGILLALRALALPAWAMGPAVFGALTIGFFSKESTLVSVPLLAWSALVTAPVLHTRPRRFLRAALALVASVGALVLYTEVRRKYFPVAVPEVSLPSGASVIHRGFAAFLAWFSQPKLPVDPINNPLVDADTAHRVAGALIVYAKGLGQTFFPWTLSGDYSYRAEPIPDRVVTGASVSGAALLVLPVVAGVVVWVRALLAERAHAGLLAGAPPAPGAVRHDLVLLVCFALALVWVPIAYFPHSNIPVLLPTVRAERFWYVPVIGSSLGVGAAAAWLLATPLRQWCKVLVALFLSFQAVRARVHALDYNDDLVFWRATAPAAPESAKGHLNYGVMLGARGKLDERLAENKRALDIAPRWPMAHVYYADTLCRLHRAEAGWKHYADGFRLAPNDRNLIALGLQCLWDEGAILAHRHELLDMAADHKGSWLAYLARDVVHNGKKHNGVDPQYRPRGYDEGPKNK